MELTVMRDKGDLCYYVYLIDSDDEQDGAVTIL